MHKGINTTLDEGHTPVLAFPANLSGTQRVGEDAMPSLMAKNPTAVVYVKGTNPHSKDEAPTFKPTETSACMNGWDERHNPPKHLVTGLQVRKLMPVECERLMGFPDFYTEIPGSSDTSRYKALGNSWAVPVVQWIGTRIDAAITSHREAA